MANIPYTIFRISEKTEKRLKLLSCLLGIPIAGPYLASWLLALLGVDPIWFNRYFDHSVRSNGFIAGPYLFFAGIILFCVGILVGNDTMKYGQDTNYNQEYKDATNRFGVISQIMLICQILAPFISLWGLMWLFSSFK